MYKLSIQVSCIATVISLFVSIINYLVAYATGKMGILDAIFTNIYVKYWVYLAAFFLGLTILLLFVFLIIKPKNNQLYLSNKDSEYTHTYAYPSSRGTGPVDEYVNIRVKKSELSKYQ